MRDLNPAAAGGGATRPADARSRRRVPGQVASSDVQIGLVDDQPICGRYERSLEPEGSIKELHTTAHWRLCELSRNDKRRFARLL